MGLDAVGIDRSSDVANVESVISSSAFVSLLKKFLSGAFTSSENYTYNCWLEWVGSCVEYPAIGS